MAKKSSVLRQERRQTGGGEVPKEAELTDFEMRFLEEPILTLPLSTPFDSDSTDIEISTKPAGQRGLVSKLSVASSFSSSNWRTRASIWGSAGGSGSSTIVH
ncbi:hypothetical protein TNCV_1064702 [Trichonephila clavipes]|nr:hypothetical protein TNCV_1064702 [Trichonephila clavipes]